MNRGKRINPAFPRALAAVLSACFAVSAGPLRTVRGQEAVLRPPPTPRPDHLRVQREILDLKVRKARDPRSAASVRESLARIYLEAGQPERAVGVYRRGILFDRPRAAVYHRRIARIYRDQGRDAEAEEELRLAAAAAPEHRSTRSRRQLAAWEAEGRHDLLLQQYRFLYWTRDGSGDQYLRQLARLLTREGEEAEADRYWRLLIADYRSRIAERPEAEADYLLRIAGIHNEMGDRAAAAEEYRRAAAAEGEEGGRALLRKADFYRSLGETARALELYREAEGRPRVDTASVRLRISSLLERDGRREESLEELRRAAEIDGDEDGRIGLRISSFLERRGDREEALTALREVIPRLDPVRRAQAWERAGALLSRLEREDEARGAYRDALRLREEGLGGEEPSAAFLERGLTLADRAGEEELASDYARRLLELYRRLLDREPDRAPYYHRRLGDLFRDRGEFRRAAAHYRSWTALEPDNPIPHYRLYRIYRDHLDNPRGAERHRNRYRELREARRSG